MSCVRTKTVKKSSRLVIERSAIEVDEIKVDKETIDMLASLGMSDLSRVVDHQAAKAQIAAPPAFGHGATRFWFC
ncbi:hypothetical protein QQ045_016988 [Rhodiola kirilowii]